MLSDESSSDSETGRFKCRTKNEDEKKKNSRDDSFRSLGRGRLDRDRFSRDGGRKRDEKERYERNSRERPRPSRHSPARRRHTRERSLVRRSRERERPRYRGDSRPKSKTRDLRSNSKEKKVHARTKSHKSPEYRRDLKEELKRHLKTEVMPTPIKEKSVEKTKRQSRDKSSSPSAPKQKKSVILKPTSSQRKKSKSPIVIDEHKSDESEEVLPGSYYSLIPAVVKDKEVSPVKETVVVDKLQESSEIDSSDDEKLRAKLLNLEKELNKTKKKKHKKKHKKKNLKSIKEKDRDSSAVEVTSTTDIDKPGDSTLAETADVTSTQKSALKETSEEGEISSEEDSQEHFDIDPTDLRHKLKRSRLATNKDRVSSNTDACGPALPPHLQGQSRSRSREREGPALPPHLQSKSRNIGPSIPEDMRKVLAERGHGDSKYVSSDEDLGIGPLPAGTEEKWSDAHKRLEERALDIKIKKLDGHSSHKNIKSREQWMLELPEGKAKYLGLEARSFRAKQGPDMSDRSSWTDTPEEKARKAAGIAKEEDAQEVLQREARARAIASRDEEQEKIAKKHKKKHKREESLLDMHQKKLKKKKKREEKVEGKPERRPFSRDVDLQVNRFDEAQKRSIIKKAQGLDTRFSHGESKYL